jgi:hypothetical protein
MQKSFLKLFISLLVFASFLVTTQADVISITSFDSGYYSKIGKGKKATYEHTKTDAIAEKGHELDSNSYYVFDLSSISKDVISATFEFTDYDANGPKLSLNQVTTDINDLMNGIGDFKKIHDDIKKDKYSKDSSPKVYELNAKALQDIINAGNGLFAIGVDYKEKKHGWFSSLTASLTLTTAAPEASEIIMLLITVLLLFWFYNHQKKNTPVRH